MKTLIKLALIIFIVSKGASWLYDEGVSQVQQAAKFKHEQLAKI